MFKNMFDYLHNLIYDNKVSDIVIYLLGKNLGKDLHNLKNTDKLLYDNEYVTKQYIIYMHLKTITE